MSPKERVADQVLRDDAPERLVGDHEVVVARLGSAAMRGEELCKRPQIDQSFPFGDAQIVVE
jgi:hypothetical protein